MKKEELTVLLGNEKGEFRDIKEIKSDLFSTLPTAYHGSKLKSFMADSFYILETYISFFKDFSTKNPEERKAFPRILFKKDYISFQWDPTLDPIINLYEKKSQVLYMSRDTFQWNAAEGKYEKSRSEILDNSIEIIKKIKNYYLPPKTVKMEEVNVS